MFIEALFMISKAKQKKKKHETGNKVNVPQSGNDWINFGITSLLNAGGW